MKNIERNGRLLFTFTTIHNLHIVPTMYFCIVASFALSMTMHIRNCGRTNASSVCWKNIWRAKFVLNYIDEAIAAAFE